jgi:hypothetical protein
VHPVAETELGQDPVMLQWRSSNTAITGCDRDAARNAPPMASNSRKPLLAGVDQRSGSRPHRCRRFGDQAAYLRVAMFSSWSRELSSLAPVNDRRTCNQGQNPGAPSPSQQRPQATAAPCDRAYSQISSASRVLPTPGSPASSVSPPRPIAASSTAAEARAEPCPVRRNTSPVCLTHPSHCHTLN